MQSCGGIVEARNRSRTAARFATGVLALLLLAATAATASGTDGPDDAAALRLSQGAIGNTLDDLQLTDQGGRPLGLAGLRGRPLVLHLVYTNCYQVCSSLTVHLRDVVQIARSVLGADSFAVLTVGFDTGHDTPERMRAYGRDRRIDMAQWHFATADAYTVRRLADQVGFTWTAAAEGFDHITQVTIVDAAGRVVEQVYGADFEPPALVEPLKQLIRQRPVDRSSVRDILDRVRLICTVYDPASGRYGFDYSMILSVLPALLVLGMAGVAILVAARRTR